jgi:hypothetical protein
MKVVLHRYVLLQELLIFTEAIIKFYPYIDQDMLANLYLSEEDKFHLGKLKLLVGEKKTRWTLNNN